MRYYLNNIEHTFILLGVLLAIVKTYFFFRNIPGNKTLADWLHFDSYERVNARSSGIRRSMNVQNGLTVAIFLLLLVAILAHIVKNRLIP